MTFFHLIGLFFRFYHNLHICDRHFHSKGADIGAHIFVVSLGGYLVAGKGLEGIVILLFPADIFTFNAVHIYHGWILVHLILIRRHLQRNLCPLGDPSDVKLEHSVCLEGLWELLIVKLADKRRIAVGDYIAAGHFIENELIIAEGMHLGIVALRLADIVCGIEVDLRILRELKPKPLEMVKEVDLIRALGIEACRKTRVSLDRMLARGTVTAEPALDVTLHGGTKLDLIVVAQLALGITMSTMPSRTQVITSSPQS